MLTSPAEVVTVSALSLTLASVPRTGVMSAGAPVVVAESVAPAATDVLAPAAESCAAAERSCFAHPPSTSSAAESVASEVNASPGVVSDIWRIVKLLWWRLLAKGNWLAREALPSHMRDCRALHG